MRWIRKNSIPAVLLLVCGFMISLTSVLIGISMLQTVLDSVMNVSEQLPVYETIQNTGLSLSAAIYLFSIVNCLVVTHYWMVTHQKEMAIRKAVGWSSLDLIWMICGKLVVLIGWGLAGSAVIIALFQSWNQTLFSIEMTPFFAVSTILILVITLLISMSVPIVNILKLNPSEVIS